MNGGRVSRSIEMAQKGFPRVLRAVFKIGFYGRGGIEHGAGTRQVHTR